MTLIDSALPYAELLERIRSTVPRDTPIHLVGGAVRDLLLQRPSHDLDFTLPKDAIRLSRKIAKSLGAPFFPIDRERDTGRIILTECSQQPDRDGNRLILDFASYRGKDLESDLRDRDFTINAIAINLDRPGSLFDPLGGAKDLKDGIIRACSDTAFDSDPIRILRCVRLAIEFEFRIQKETRKQIDKALPKLSFVSTERMRDELFRILEGPKPFSALRSLEAMRALDYVLPELSTLRGVDQSAPHIDNLWEHTFHTGLELTHVLNVLAIKPDPSLSANWRMGFIALKLGRFRCQLHEHLATRLNPERSIPSLLMLAALYHDVGKPGTQVFQEERIRFLKHELVGASMVAERGRKLHLSNSEIERLRVIVKNHMRPNHLANDKTPPSRRSIYRFFRDCDAAGVDICLLFLADTLATYGPTLPEEIWMKHLDVVSALFEAWWENREREISPPKLIDGDQLMQVYQIEPGPKLGRLLEAIRESQAAGELQAYDDALEFAHTWLENH